MKKLIMLFGGMIIAASAAAQTPHAASSAAQPAKAGTADRQAPMKSDSSQRVNPAAEPKDSANSVSTDFQGSSKQESTASGMGHPKKHSVHKPKHAKTGSTAHDAENKPKQ